MYYFHSKYTQKLILSVILYYFHSKYTQKYLLCVILCGFHYKYTQNRPIFGLFFTINALKIAFWGYFWVIFVCYPCFSLKIHTKLVFFEFLCDFHSKYTQKPLFLRFLCEKCSKNHIQLIEEHFSAFVPRKTSM